MLQIVIFSFNRAIQLDTLIFSFLRHWKSPEYRIDVLYNTSSEEFEKGYALLQQKLTDHPEVRFSKEQNKPSALTLSDFMNPYNLKHLWENPKLRNPKTDFRSRLISLLTGNESRQVMFLTDDAVFIHDVDVSEETLNWVSAEPRERQFSLRIGVGMNHQPATGIEERDGQLSWDMSRMKNSTSWGYPFSVDAHIYDKKEVVKLFRKLVFANPNTLEAYINGQVSRTKMFVNAKAPVQAKLLSFPINMVQSVIANENLGVSPVMLNEYYLNGYTFEYQMPEKVDSFQVFPKEVYFVRNGERITVKTV